MYVPFSARITYAYKQWTAQKPLQEIKAAPLKSKSKSKSKSIDDRKEGLEITTKYKTTQTSFGRFFIECKDINITELGLEGSTLLLPTVGVGNIAQIAIDILLTTLINKGKLIKIGYINDRNLISGVGNDGLLPKQKKSKKGKKIEGILNVPIEVYWYKECNLVIVQQRCAVRHGGRGGFVQNMIQFITRLKFAQVVILTSEYITKRNDLETNDNIKLVYYHNDIFHGIQQTIQKLRSRWMPTFKIMEKKARPTSKLLVVEEEEEEEEDENKDENKEDMVDDDDKGEFYIIGHGITKKLYDELVRIKKSVIVCCEYSEDGDNTQESMEYLEKIIELIDVMGGDENVEKIGDVVKKWKQPYSLSFANGGKLPNGIY